MKRLNGHVTQTHMPYHLRFSIYLLVVFGVAFALGSITTDLGLVWTGVTSVAFAYFVIRIGRKVLRRDHL